VAKSRKLTHQQISAMLLDMSCRMTGKDAPAEYGICQASVGRWKPYMGLNVKKGSENISFRPLGALRSLGHVTVEMASEVYMQLRKLTRDQAARMLFEYQPGINSSAVAKKYGISQRAVWLWRNYKGLDARWLSRVKNLEHELVITKRRCNRLETHLKIATALIKRFQPSPKKRSVLATGLRATHDLNRKRANIIMGLCQGAGENSKVASEERRLIALMRSYLAENPGQGFLKMFRILLRDEPCTRALAIKLYRDNGLAFKKRTNLVALPVRILKPMQVQSRPDHVWSMDFLVDALPTGDRFWVLAVIDDFNREAVVIKVATRNTAKFVIEALGDVVFDGRQPKSIRTDNGGEFHSVSYETWTDRHRIKRIYSRPGKPTDNAYVERFNGALRREIFSRFSFRSLAEVQRMLDDWRIRYNMARPQKRLGWLSPLQYTEFAKLG